MHRQEIFPLLSGRGIEGEVNQINFMKIITIVRVNLL